MIKVFFFNEGGSLDSQGPIFSQQLCFYIFHDIYIAYFTDTQEKYNQYVSPFSIFIGQSTIVNRAKSLLEGYIEYLKNHDASYISPIPFFLRFLYFFF